MGSIGTWGTVIMIVVVIAVFYLFGIRPQRKQEKEAQDMRNSLCVGDEITTIGGIIGKVVSIKEETMIIETGRDHTRIRFLKSAVRTVDVHAEDTKEAQEKAAKKAEKTEKAAKNEKPAKAVKAEAKAEATPEAEAGNPDTAAGGDANGENNAQ